MEKEIISKSPKFSVQIKQSAKGKYYLGSFKINAESENELEELLDTMLPRVISRIRKLNSPKKKKKSKKNKIVLTDEDKAIYRKLKSLRNKIARDKDIPAYLVFQNDTLKLIALSKPENKEMMLNIRGVGEKNFKSYGKQFIDYLHILLEESS
jgi:superfamily II DNA helicase RecQ